MDLKELIANCLQFNRRIRIASDIELPNTEKDNTLLMLGQLRRAETLLPNAFQAQVIFNHIKDIRNSNLPQANKEDKLRSDPWYMELQRILLQIQFLEGKVPNYADLLALPENCADVVKNNLTILMNSTNFGEYKQFNIPQENKTIDIDEWQANQQKDKKDVGF